LPALAKVVRFTLPVLSTGLAIEIVTAAFALAAAKATMPRIVTICFFM